MGDFQRVDLRFHFLHLTAVVTCNKDKEENWSYESLLVLFNRSLSVFLGHQLHSNYCYALALIPCQPAMQFLISSSNPLLWNGITGYARQKTDLLSFYL